MSTCIKDLFDYDLLKKCSKCGNISLKSNFNKNKTNRDGHTSECRSCCKNYSKKYYYDNQDRLLNKQNCMINKTELR